MEFNLIQQRRYNLSVGTLRIWLGLALHLLSKVHFLNKLEMKRIVEK